MTIATSRFGSIEAAHQPSSCLCLVSYDMSPETPHGAQKHLKGRERPSETESIRVRCIDSKHSRKFPKHSIIKHVKLEKEKKKQPLLLFIKFNYSPKKKKKKSMLFLYLPFPPPLPPPLTFFVCSKSFIAFNGSDRPAAAIAVCKSSSMAA